MLLEVRLHQPDVLKSDEYQIWSRGRGVDVWAMLQACAQGDIPAVEALLGRDPNLPECELLEQGMDARSPNWLGATPLHRFALGGRRDMAEPCLEFGAQLDPVDDEFCSPPLGWAARAGQTEMVRWLLERGADRGLPRDKHWAQPLAWATRRGHSDLAALLR